MPKNKKSIVVVFSLLVIMFASSCMSKFEKLRLSSDVTRKYEEALRLYNKKDYNRALILFEDLAQRYRGRAEAEDIYYYYAYTNYRLKDYINARYHFKIFAETYPHSSKTEECRFMAGKCYYLESPIHSLDQQNTLKAIDALQLFINLYPKSERVAEASTLIDHLRYKLETKSYHNAKLFLDIGNYKSAVIAFKNSLRDYPDTKYTEEIEYLMVKAQYLFAKNSIENKQEDRFNEAILLAVDFLTKYPLSKHHKEVEHLKKESKLGITSVQKMMAQEEFRTQQQVDKQSKVKNN